MKTATLVCSMTKEKSIWRMLRTYLLETKYEILKAWRLPAFSVPTITFPVLFYILFGLSFTAGKGRDGIDYASYLLATYGAFGAMGPALFGFGIGVAVERGQGWMLLKRATPMPPFAYFFAKTATALVFGALVLFLMGALGTAFGGVRFEASTWAALFVVVLLGAIPFCALGLVLGFACGPNSAPAIVNLIFLPAAFASGMWIPIRALPRFFKLLAPFLPSYHYAQLALHAIGASPSGNPWRNAAALAGFGICCLALARLAYLRDDGRTFG